MADRQMGPVRPALDALDAMISEEAEIANRMAVAFPRDFDRLSAGVGAGIRLQALVDARQRIVVAGLRQHEEVLELSSLWYVTVDSEGTARHVTTEPDARSQRNGWSAVAVVPVESLTAAWGEIDRLMEENARWRDELGLPR